MLKGLEVHQRQDRKNRPVWSWLQKDKLSSAWLQALPGTETNITSAEFREAATSMLCLPSPACLERLGEVVKGNQRVDLYGDVVQSASLPGDHFRKRHDRCKMKIYRTCLWAGLEAEVEVFNLFSSSIPQEGLSRMERGRKIQSIVPDLRITIPIEGVPTPSLHEVKVISSSVTRYTPHRQGQESARAVQVRANQLNHEYILKARNTDELYCGTPRGVTGPVENKLATMGEVKGIVFGGFGECSDALHKLIYELAVSRVKVAGPQLGKRGQVRSEQAEIAINTAMLRRAFSVCSIKAQTSSLLSRLEMIGKNTADSIKRRNFSLQQEVRWSQMRQAHAISLKQAKSLLRKGQFKLT